MSSKIIFLASTCWAIAPPQTFLDAVLEADDAAELTELDVSEALLESELAIDDVAELRELDAFDAPVDTSLAPEDMEELAASERLEADSETTEAADLTLSDAFSPMPGSLPTIEEEALAERLLALWLATEAMLSTLPCEVPTMELDA